MTVACESCVSNVQSSVFTRATLC